MSFINLFQNYSYISCTCILILFIMKKQYKYSEGFIEFGSTVDTKSFLYFIVIKDIDQTLIKIPFRDNSYQEITIKRLAQLYLLQTSCKKLLTSKPAFRVIQGEFQGQIIPQQSKLFSLGVNISKPCFQIQDSSKIKEQQSLYFTNKMLKKEAKIQEIVLNIMHGENSYKQKVTENEKIHKLKAGLLIKKQFFKVTIDMIQLRYGEVLLDSQNSIKDYNMINGSVINATILKKEGCFRGHMKVRVYDDKCNSNNKQIKEKYIKEMNIGDQIISYNEERQIFQRDYVTGIHQSMIDELTQIILEDKSIIETTSNHLFLCHDNQYRKLHYSSSNSAKLQQGMLLKTSEGQLKIQTIRHKVLSEKQYFYHLLIKNNHNYFVNGIIVHNMFIKIDYQKHLQQLNVSQTQTIGSIKNILQNVYKKHNSNCMKLLYNGTQLKNKNSLSDNNIKKESKLNLVIKNADYFNYFHGQTKIKIKDGYKSIKDLGEGDEICLYVSENNINLHNFKQNEIKTKQITEYFLMELSSSQRKFELKMLADTYLQLQNGQSKSISEIYEQYTIQNKILLKSLKQSIKIQKMSIKKQKLSFCKLNFQNIKKYGYIIQQQIVIHNDIIHFHYQNEQQTKNLNLSISSESKVADLKEKICNIANIKLNKGTSLNFICNQKILGNNSTFFQQGIKFQDIVIVTASKNVQSKIFIDELVEQEQNKKIYLKTESNEEYELDYESNKTKTIKQTMNKLIPNYKSSFFFMFGGRMLQPTDCLSILQETEYFNQAHNIVLVIKNQRLSFIINMNIEGLQIKNYSQIQYALERPIILQLQYNTNNNNNIQQTKQYKEAKNRIQNNTEINNNFFKQQQFYKPFLYFTSLKYKEDIDNFIRNFQIHLKGNNQTDYQKFIFKLIKNLYINVGYLPNYIEKPLKQTFFGMRNFRMSQYFQKNQTFYWYSFLKTTGNQQYVRSQLQGSSGTLYHIISTTGKQINKYSIYPPEEEVQLLFLPYTYFVINRIVKTDTIDEVWLTEIASPTSFQKNIILWVDDIPFNNMQEVYEIQREYDVEIIQLISTLAAQKWLKQFGWFLTWKNINFKLITDNFREQYTEKDEGIVKVSKAGFQLLQKIYLRHGMTTKCCIYTGSKSAAEAVLLQSYPQISDRYKSSFWISHMRKQILQFCKQP